MKMKLVGNLCALTLTVLLASTAFAGQGEGKAKKPGGKAPPDAAQRFAMCDTDGNGSISLAEFTANHEARQAKMKERMGDKWDAERAAKRSPEMMFKKLDTNGDGTLSPEEMAAGPEMRKPRPDKKAGGKGKKANVDSDEELE